MTNSKNTSVDISMNRQKSEQVASFKYLGVTLFSSATAEMERLNRI